MKFAFVISVSIFVSVTASAVDIPQFESKYSFEASALKIQQVQHIVNLVVMSSEAKQVLADLRQSGYICRYIANNMNQCRLFVSEKPESREVREKVVAENTPLVLNFEKSSDDYSLINEGDMLLEFEKYQNSSFGKNSYDKIRFYILPDLSKFKIYDSRISANADYFYMTAGGEIAKQIVSSKTNKRTASFITEDKHNYLYEGIWK